MPRLRLAAAVLVLCALAPASAPAHTGNPNYESRVAGITPRLAGLTVSVVNRDDRFLLVNRSGRPVVVEGYEGEPYARVDGDGTVAVNTHSKAYYLNAERDGDVPIPAGVGAKATPRWKRVDETGRFEWHDHRMHWMGRGRPSQVTDPDVRTKVFDYAVPVRVAGRPGAITGTLFWTPRPDSDLPLGAIFAFAAVVIVLCVAVLFVRRRRGPYREAGATPEAW